MSVSAQNSRAMIGLTFLVAMIFLAALLAVLGVAYHDDWAKGGVVAAVVIAILLYWSITKEKKSEQGTRAAA
jgi:hypothetical protein